MSQGKYLKLVLLLTGFAVVLAAVALTTSDESDAKPSYVSQLPEDRQDESCGACHLGEGDGGVMVDVHAVCTSCHFISTVESLQVTAYPVDANFTPVIDGQLEPVWGFSRPTNIKLSGGEAQGPPLTLGNGWETTVGMRALFTPKEVFFALEWEDPAEDLGQPWRQNETTGLWELPSWREAGQDKVGLLWETRARTAGFVEYGCLATCHLVREGGGNETTPLKYTSNRGEVLDMWLWSAGLSNQVGQADDQFVNASRAPPEGGRFGDGTGLPGQGGYLPNLQYLNNSVREVAVPRYIELWEDDSRDRYVITRAEIDAGEAVPITAVDAQGQLYYGEGSKLPDSVYRPAYIVAPFTADRGDVRARGTWEDGAWTLELARNLTTASPDDVQFADLNTYYLFGLAVFDNAGQGHAYHPAAFQLNFATGSPRVTEEPENTDWFWAALTSSFFAFMVVLLLVGMVTRYTVPHPEWNGKPEAKAEIEPDAAPADSGPGAGDVQDEGAEEGKPGT